MRATVRNDPSYPWLELELDANETVVADAGSMVARHGDVRTSIALDAGGDASFWVRLRAFAVAVLRKWVNGEHFHANKLAAPPAGGWVWLAPALAGAIRNVKLVAGDTWTLTPGAFVGSGPGVKLRPRFAGLTALFSRESTFWLEVTGEGDAWLCGHGALDEIVVDGSHVVSADHLVAYAAPLKAKVRGGTGASFLTRGDARDVELTGRGRALVQARGAGALVAWLSPRLPD